MSKSNNIQIQEFIIEKKIGSGSFGEVYEVVDTKTQERKAIKVEEVKTDSVSILQKEYDMYKKLYELNYVEDNVKIYKMIYTEKYNILVMELLDKSLEKLFNESNKKFDILFVINLAVDILNLIEKLHNSNVIHRDIKPDNFMYDKNGKLKLIDFGLSKIYYKNNRHIKFKDNRSLIGTARYASVNMHIGIEPTRRDDMESIGYMLIYFAKGKLPWQGLKKNKDNNKPNLEQIKDVKLCLDLNILCKGLPKCFKEYMEYIRNLEFSEKPNYEYLKNLFLEYLKNQIN
jgi:serine/threonine protein kinase